MKYSNLWYYIICLLGLISGCGPSRSNNNLSQESDKIVYYEKDVIKERAEYLNDMRNGLTVEYYRSGNVKSKTNWVSDMMYGHQFFYYDNVDTVIIARDTGSYLAVENDLEKYSFFIEGEHIFRVNLTRDDSVTMFEGNPVLVVTTDTLDANSINFEFQFPPIPDLVYEVYVVSIYDYGYEIVESLTVDFEKNQADFDISLDKLKELKLGLMLDMNLYSYSKRDTVYFPTFASDNPR